MKTATIALTFNPGTRLFHVWFAPNNQTVYKLLGEFSTGEQAVLFADEMRA